MSYQPITYSETQKYYLQLFPQQERNDMFMQRRFLFATSSSIYGNSKLCPNIHKFMIGLEILDFMLAYYISQGYLEKQNYLYTLFLSHFSVFISLCVTASLSLLLSICMCVYFSVFSLSHTQRHTNTLHIHVHTGTAQTWLS